MAHRLTQLNNKRFGGILDFMEALRAADFTNEFDNARVLRILSEKVDEVWVAVKRKGSVFITTETKPSQLHETDLIVIVNSTERTDVQSAVMLFVRPDRGSLSVYTNVLSQQVKPDPNDLPAAQEVSWEEAEKIFRTHPRFNEQAFLTFRAVYDSISPPGVDMPCTLHLTPNHTHLNVGYKVKGNKVMDVRFGYNR